MKVEAIREVKPPPIKEVVISMSEAEAQDLFNFLAPCAADHVIYDLCCELGAALGHWGSR